MSSLWQRTVREIYDNDEDWFDRAYVIDWYVDRWHERFAIHDNSCRTVATAFWALSGLATLSPVFQREFSADDPLINHPHTHEQ
jgi:hypothetical protein